MKMVGRDGFEPSKAYASRFTVCPIWPLWNLPKREREWTHTLMRSCDLARAGGDFFAFFGREKGREAGRLELAAEDGGDVEVLAIFDGGFGIIEPAVGGSGRGAG